MKNDLLRFIQSVKRCIHALVSNVNEDLKVY